MVKKAVIEISLLKESVKVTNKKIEKEILEALSKETIIPWMRNVKKVRVTEA
jgi:hypothetical protein